MSTTRRDLLGWLAAATFLPSNALAKDDRPCHPHAYLPWIERREKKWPDRIGQAGFVNYYGEAFSYDVAVNVVRDTVPTCEVWGADASTLDNGPLPDHAHTLQVRGLASSTDCHIWPGDNAADFEAKVAGLVEQLRVQCPDPVGQPVSFHAVGSHHSSSDVYRRPVDGQTAVVVRVDGLNQILTDRPEWRTEWRPELIGTSGFALVGAGITVCHLNEALWSLGLALETQGSFDGQSLAGAISTGTHGAGAEHGAIADSIEAVIVVTCVKDPDSGAPRWEVLQVEPDPDEAISDATRFEADRGGLTWRLVQDRRVFDALIVPMGTMGVIVGYVMRVRKAYFLREQRVGRTWTEVARNLVERATVPATGFADNGWRYELVVNPFALDGDPEWVCTEVYRDAWEYDLDYLPESRVIPDKWAGGVTRTVNLGGSLGATLGRKANDALVKGARVGKFADRAYRVLKLGQGEYVQAWGTEFMVPAELGADMVSWILRTNPERGELKRFERRNDRLVNPFGVRFARGRRGYLSPTRRYQDGKPGLVCTCEISEAVKDNDVRNLGVRDNGKPSAKAILDSWADRFVAEFGKDARLHWGQLQGTTGEDAMKAAYPQEDIDGFYAAFRTLNPFGLFDNGWARRLGFVARRQADTAPVLRFRGLGA